MKIDGQKYLGGAIPINFKVAIDLLSKLKIRFVNCGYGTWYSFLISTLEVKFLFQREKATNF